MVDYSSTQMCSGRSMFREHLRIDTKKPADCGYTLLNTALKCPLKCIFGRQLTNAARTAHFCCFVRLLGISLAWKILDRNKYSKYNHLWNLEQYERGENTKQNNIHNTYRLIYMHSLLGKFPQEHWVCVPWNPIFETRVPMERVAFYPDRTNLKDAPSPSPMRQIANVTRSRRLIQPEWDVTSQDFAGRRGDRYDAEQEMFAPIRRIFLSAGTPSRDLMFAPTDTKTSCWLYLQYFWQLQPFF